MGSDIPGQCAGVSDCVHDTLGQCVVCVQCGEVEVSGVFLVCRSELCVSVVPQQWCAVDRFWL